MLCSYRKLARAATLPTPLRLSLWAFRFIISWRERAAEQCKMVLRSCGHGVCKLASVPYCGMWCSKNAWPLKRFPLFWPGWCMYPAYNMVAKMLPDMFLKMSSSANYFSWASTKIRMPFPCRAEELAIHCVSQWFRAIHQVPTYTYVSWKSWACATHFVIEVSARPKLERQHEHVFRSSFNTHWLA